MTIEGLYEERSRLLTQRRLKRFPGSARRRLMRLERRINGIQMREYAPERRRREQELEAIWNLVREAEELLEWTKSNPTAAASLM